MTGPVTGGDAHLDWAVAGRPVPGEAVNGDTAVHVELGGYDVLAVVDGLGHGPAAAEAASRAAAVMEGHAGEPIDAVLGHCHADLARTRGVAMTIASVGRDGTMRWVGVGNVEAHVIRLEGTRPRRVASAVLYGGVVGYRLPRLRVSTFELAAGDLLLMATDGVLIDVDDLSIGDPVDRLVATIIERHARPADDALVVAARYRGAA